MIRTHARRFVTLIVLSTLAACDSSGTRDSDGGVVGDGGVITQTWTVTAEAGANGSITPATATVTHGDTTSFTVTPEEGHAIVGVSGCGGSLSGNTYTTGAITAACTVSATFAKTYTVGGIVSGLAWGYGVVLGSDGGDELPISANGSFTFSTPVVDGGAYRVFVVTQPAGMSCSVVHGAGNVGAANVTVEVVCRDRVMALYPNHGADWNDYVVNDGADVWDASDVSCTGDETSGYSTCIHGGERRVVAVAGAQSCLGLTAMDELDAFEWRCDESSGYVRFVSSGLKPNRRLADLVDFSVPAWRRNSVTVREGDATVAVSASTAWWSNPLVVSGTSAMNAPGTVYLVPARARGSYEIGADRIALVIRRDTAIDGPGTATSVVTATGRKFLWIEGAVDALGDLHGIDLNAVSHSVLRHVKVVNGNDEGYGVRLETCHSNSLRDIVVSNGGRGFGLVNSDSNSLVGLTTIDNLHTGLHLLDYSNDNVVMGVTSSLSGAFLSYSYGNVFTNVAVASSMKALESDHSWRNVYADMAISDCSIGIHHRDSSYDTFTGLLKIGSNTADCVVSGGGTDPGLINVTCANQGASNATIVGGITLGASFFGKVLTDDGVNASDNGGAAGYPSDPGAFDWTRFENDFRAWGHEITGLRWTSGIGRIRDWSLASADTVVLNVLALPTGDDTITHTSTDQRTSTFLRHAMELYGDGDGLCESHETCLHTPNIGAYQGQGALVSAGAFVDGVVTGVTLLRYESNGR